MKVQLFPQQNNNNNEVKTPKFKGVADTALRFLATNQAIGANAVDVCFMVTPRTASDTIKRGPAAGLETGRRESMGTINDSLIGVYGAAAGALVAHALNNTYGTDVNKLFTAPETLQILAENKSNQLKNKQSQLDYIKTTLSSLKGYNPSSTRADAEGYVKLSKSTINDISKLINEALDKKSGQTIKTWTSGKSETLRHAIMNKITEDTGAQSNYILESKDKKIKSQTNLKSFLNDIYIVTDSFNSKKVNEAFLKQIKSGKGINDNAFIKGLTRFMKTRAGIGFMVGSAVGLSVQPINMYLTKLKTGTDGFVGVEGRSKDNSASFLGAKCLSSAAFFSMILGTLNMSPLKFTPKKFMDKMAFNGKMPTLNQLKGIYGVTIVSRIFSARDKDELREVLTKDTLGYLSWLVLGDFINRIVAERLDNSTVNIKKGTEDSQYLKKMFYASLKTRDEILVKTLAENGISTTKKTKDGKLVAKSFKEMQKDIDKLTPKMQNIVKKRLKTLNKAQIAGYLFSGLVLGLGIPNLNIYITNVLDKKRKEEEAKKKQYSTVA